MVLVLCVGVLQASEHALAVAGNKFAQLRRNVSQLAVAGEQEWGRGANCQCDVQCAPLRAPTLRVGRRANDV